LKGIKRSHYLTIQSFLVVIDMRERKEATRIVVLRIGHRFQRDMRVTTHVCLTARALGAEGVVVSDVSDKLLTETINRVTAEFGGSFTIETGRPWRTAVMKWKESGGTVVHLTAYGIPLPRIISQIQRSKTSKLIVVGAEKVPGEVFKLADWNVAVTNQPISEVSALGIFLDWYFDHSRLEERFLGGRLQIIPTERGKRVLRG
jgi:tRNA (cytidine56-2'-O)-methyltransferase